MDRTMPDLTQEKEKKRDYLIESCILYNNFALDQKCYGKDSAQCKYAWNQYCEHKDMMMKAIAMEKTDNTVEIPTYLVTFTLSDEHKDVEVKTFEKHINKLVNCRTSKPSNYYGVMELTKQGRLHCHLMIEYPNKIKSGYGKAYFTKASGWSYGYIDVRKIKKDNGVEKYLDKDQMKEHALPTFGTKFN